MLRLNVPKSGARNILRASAMLTTAGRAVLAGDEDRVELCGIDRWIGGVRLEGHGAVWRWDEALRRITKAT